MIEADAHSQKLLSKPITLRIHPSLWQRFNQKCIDEAISPASLIIRLIDKELKGVSFNKDPKIKETITCLSCGAKIKSFKDHCKCG